MECSALMRVWSVIILALWAPSVFIIYRSAMAGTATTQINHIKIKEITNYFRYNTAWQGLTMAANSWVLGVDQVHSAATFLHRSASTLVFTHSVLFIICNPPSWAYYHHFWGQQVHYYTYYLIFLVLWLKCFSLFYHLIDKTRLLLLLLIWFVSWLQMPMIWTSMVPYRGLQARILNILQKFNSSKFLVNYVKGMLLKLKTDFCYNSNWQNISRHIHYWQKKSGNFFFWANISIKSSPNSKSKVSFVICLFSAFQNCPYFWHLAK